MILSAGEDQTDFDFPFDYLSRTDLRVYINGTLTTDWSLADANTVRLDAAPAEGDQVIIKRVTNVDEPVVDFNDDAPLLASDLDRQALQLLYAVQELQVRIDDLSEGSGGDGSLPDPLGANYLLVSTTSGPGYVWQQRTVAEVQSLLGVATPVYVPTPSLGNKFLITNDVTNTYELASPTTVKGILGLNGYSLPNAAGNANKLVLVNSAGDGYDLADATQARTLLSIGSAGTKNVGTSVGNVVGVVSSGSGAALPALWGGNLTGIAKTPEYVVARRSTPTTVNGSTTTAVMTYGLTSEQNTTGATWYTLNPSINSGNQVVIGVGVFRVDYQLRIKGSNTGASAGQKIKVRLVIYRRNDSDGAPLAIPSLLDGIPTEFTLDAGTAEERELHLSSYVRNAGPSNSGFQVQLEVVGTPDANMEVQALDGRVIVTKFS